jgi:hypothetical protein
MAITPVQIPAATAKIISFTQVMRIPPKSFLTNFKTLPPSHLIL